MKISDIEIIPITPKDGLVAFCSIVYDNAIKIKCIGIYTRMDGSIRITFPTRKRFDDIYVDIVHPINKETYDLIEQAIYEKYNEVIIKSYQG